MDMKRGDMLVLVFACFLLFLSTSYYFHSANEDIHAVKKSCAFCPCGHSTRLSKDNELNQNTTASEVVELIVQRNRIARQLNDLQEQHGQLQCETRKDTIKTGGWCYKNTTKEHATDLGAAEALSKFLANKTVGSFGDGPGEYKKYILKSGRVKSYDAYDGAPFSFQNTGGMVQFLDLTLEQYGLPAYDWIVSLEVIEHIPAQFENVVLSNLARHAREGLVLSWAVEGQGGFHHVNCRNFDYVLKVMKNIGFEHDVSSSRKLQVVAHLSWIKNNINVFRRMPSVPFNGKQI